MGKKPKREIPADASASTKKEWRFQLWQLIVGSIVALAAVLIPLLWNEFKSTPQFALAKPITRPDSGIVIMAQNRAASRKAPLTIEFDGFKFADAAQLTPSSEPLCWRFQVEHHDLPESMLRDGVHIVRVGFAGESLSDSLRFIFYTEAPVVDAQITQPHGKPDDRIFVGRVASKLQAPAETLTVELVFHHEGKPQQVPVPVKRVTDEALGLTYFEFETTIVDVPRLSSKDPRYSEPFFGFRVTDQAGNQYYHSQSYAQFMAPGENRFGVASLADIEMERLPSDLRNRKLVDSRVDQRADTKVIFRFIQKPKPKTRLRDGTPPIILEVTSVTRDINRLDWTVLPLDVRDSEPLTIIFRDEKQVAVSFGQTYEDKQELSEIEPNYRVEQKGRDGQVYSSNTAKASPSELPQARVYLSANVVKQLLHEKDLFDSQWNKSGKGIHHEYEVVERDDAKLVIDHATNLTWQQTGSTDLLTYADAEKYVSDLNSKHFAGYNDWRLPTLEEVMSLMEPKKYDKLYIHQAFDHNQIFIWTADKTSASAALAIDFYEGSCGYSRVVSYSLVRAVRGR